MSSQVSLWPTNVFRARLFSLLSLIWAPECSETKSFWSYAFRMFPQLWMRMTHFETPTPQPQFTTCREKVTVRVQCALGLGDPFYRPWLQSHQMLANEFSKRALPTNPQVSTPQLRVLNEESSSHRR